MNKVLVLYAHPRPDRSETNAVLARAAARVTGVTLVDLYAEYPRFEIDVEREQARLVEHDVLVLQHPVYWYSSPALLKEWQDLVLEYGFAYGSEGRALEGKLMINAVTAGAREDVYSRTGAYELGLREYFAPFEYTARLCRMRYLSPFALYAAGHAAEEGRFDDHVALYGRLLRALVGGTLDLEAAQRADCLRVELDGLIAATDEVR
jgi:putative NADPH-quinone reductase